MMTRFERFGTRLATAVTAHPKRTLWVCIGVFLLSSLGLVWARFSTDYQIFFSHEDPGLTAFQRLDPNGRFLVQLLGDGPAINQI